MNMRNSHAHLALEILHDIQELVIHVGPIVELILDCIKIAQSVGYIERAAGIDARRCWGL